MTYNNAESKSKSQFIILDLDDEVMKTDDDYEIIFFNTLKDALNFIKELYNDEDRITEMTNSEDEYRIFELKETIVVTPNFSVNIEVK